MADASTPIDAATANRMRQPFFDFLCDYAGAFDLSKEQIRSDPFVAHGVRLAAEYQLRLELGMVPCSEAEMHANGFMIVGLRWVESFDGYGRVEIPGACLIDGKRLWHPSSSTRESMLVNDTFHRLAGTRMAPVSREISDAVQIKWDVKPSEDLVQVAKSLSNMTVLFAIFRMTMEQKEEADALERKAESMRREIEENNRRTEEYRREAEESRQKAEELRRELDERRAAHQRETREMERQIEQVLVEEHNTLIKELVAEHDRLRRSLRDANARLAAATQACGASGLYPTKRGQE